MLCMLDVETTGNTSEDEAIEVALVWTDNQGNIVDQFHSLCGTDRPIHPEAMAVHHIRQDQVRGLPGLADVIAPVWKDVDAVVAHNISFDRDYFKPALESKSIEVPPEICTYKLSKHRWPDSPRHTLQVLRYWRGLEVVTPDDLHPHRALYDTLVLPYLFRELAYGVEDAIHLTKQPVLLSKVPFGKHRGSAWADVPKSYLHWIIKTDDFDEDVMFTARHHLGN